MRGSIIVPIICLFSYEQKISLRTNIVFGLLFNIFIVDYSLNYYFNFYIKDYFIKNFNHFIRFIKIIYLLNKKL